jgi:nucleotide-binding universal stress UspA family protein
MYKKMVVLLDGSELAEVVFKYAQEVSGRMHMDAELLHVCDPREAEQLPMRRAYMERMAADLCAKAEVISSKYSKEKAAQCIQVRGNVVVGHPAEEILKYVEENDIDLVMMSTHGSSGTEAWDLGSVAHKVIHASRIPIWLVPSGLREEIIADTLPQRTLVVPLSGSKQSEAAIPHAIAILKQRGAEAEMVLLHVVDTGSISMTRAALEEKEEHVGSMKAYLDATAQLVKEAGVSVRTELLFGDPAETIINYLKDHPAQLLAMATRGHTHLSRMVFGSVTESVLHLVKKTPLLLVGEED